jgi:preprotein translocase subunit YajC
LGSAALSFQNVPPAPGRESGGTAQPSAPPAQGAPPPPEPFAGSGLVMLLPLLLIIVFMLWGSRSQAKKQQAMLASLAKGDRIILQSGIVGKLVELDDRLVKVEIAPGTKVDFLKSSIIGKDSPETQAAAEKAAAEKK